MGTHWGFADVSLFVTHSTDPRPAAITFGVAADGKSASDIWTAVKDATNVSAGIKSKLANGAAFSRIKVSLGQEDEIDLVHDMPVSIPGTGAVGSVPPNVALLVHKRTSRGGRRGRGRMFLPWSINEVKVADNGSIDAAEQVLIQACVTTWFTELNTRGVPMFLLHQEGNTPTGLPTAVNSLAVDPLVSSQRRRLHR